MVLPGKRRRFPFQNTKKNRNGLVVGKCQHQTRSPFPGSSEILFNPAPGFETPCRIYCWIYYRNDYRIDYRINYRIHYRLHYRPLYWIGCTKLIGFIMRFTVGFTIVLTIQFTIGFSIVKHTDFYGFRRFSSFF